MEAASFHETSILTFQTTRLPTPEDTIIHWHYRKKFCVKVFYFLSLCETLGMLSDFRHV